MSRGEVELLILNSAVYTNPNNSSRVSSYIHTWLTQLSILTNGIIHYSMLWILRYHYNYNRVTLINSPIHSINYSSLSSLSLCNSHSQQGTLSSFLFLIFLFIYLTNKPLTKPYLLRNQWKVMKWISFIHKTRMLLIKKCLMLLLMTQKSILPSLLNLNINNQNLKLRTLQKSITIIITMLAR